MTEDEHRSAAILVVEDEFMIAMDLRRLLEEEGFDVVGPAANVEGALALLEETSPNACVLDVNLRGKHSGPVAAALQARSIPFVLSSAYEQADLERFGAFAGVRNVGKPATPRLLLAALAELLRT